MSSTHKCPRVLESIIYEAENELGHQGHRTPQKTFNISTIENLNNILNKRIMILALPQQDPSGYNGGEEKQGDIETNGIAK